MNEAIFIGWMVVGLSIALLVYRLFGVAGMFAIIAGNVVIMNVLVTKNVVLFGIGATAGNVLYGMIFLATDILTEHHGGKVARKAVKAGFAVGIVALLASMAALAMESAPWDWAHEALAMILTPMLRIVAGSWCAYLISQLFDTHAYEFWKKRNAPIWVRNNGSTLISQFIDTAIFCSIAFIGTMPQDVFIQIVISTYLLKVIVAVVDTPFIYLSKIFSPGKEYMPAYD